MSLHPDPKIEAEALYRAKRIREVKELKKPLDKEYDEHRVWLIENMGKLLKPNSQGKATMKIGGILLSIRPGNMRVDPTLLRAELGKAADRFFRRGDTQYVVNESSDDL
jgi:hypothetical protein